VSNSDFGPSPVVHARASSHSLERRVRGYLLIRQELDRHQGLRRSTTSIREGCAVRSAQLKGAIEAARAERTI
jgi:hypothetical protein